VRDFVGAGQGEGCPTGKALDHKTFEAELIGHLYHIIGPIQQLIARPTIRASNARSIWANESNPKGFDLRLDGEYFQT
jgi:hypothetical protein